MNFDSVVNEIKTLEDQIEKQKIETTFEKNKLYNYLGNDLINSFKEHNVIIAGGLITSLFTRNEINDVDVYFRDQDSLISFLQEHWEDFILCHTKKATMFIKVSNDPDYENVNVQAIHFKYFNTPEDIFNSFDFTISMGAFDFKDESFYFHKDFMKHNAQRLLSFNRNTDYPLISLLRSNKYQDKGYNISKTELMRIIMTCMNLNIESYEELKEQLGGMYGVAYDKAFEGLKEEEFSLEKAIDQLKDLSLSEDYFKHPTNIDFENLDELIESAIGLKPRYFVHNGVKYKLDWNGNIVEGKVKDDYIEVDTPQWLKDGYAYKYVKQKDDGRLVSFYDNSFEYKLNEIMTAKDNKYGLFLGTKDNIKPMSLFEENGVLLECKIDIEDFMGLGNGSYTMFRKCTPLRVVEED